MIGNFKIVTLCGSTKFKDDFLREQKRLTLAGNIVLSVGCFGHSGDSEVWSESNKQMLDEMHKRKIDMADEIYVIDKNGYIGDSTKSEIAYAIAHGKLVKYMENPYMLPCEKRMMCAEGQTCTAHLAEGRAFACHIHTWEDCEKLEYKCDLLIGLEKKEPCKSCPRADWIDMYGHLVWGCDMSYCIADEDTL